MDNARTFGIDHSDQFRISDHTLLLSWFIVIVSAYRYIAIANLPIIPVFVEYLG